MLDNDTLIIKVCMFIINDKIYVLDHKKENALNTNTKFLSSVRSFVFNKLTHTSVRTSNSLLS